MFTSFLIFCTVVLLLCPTLLWLICWLIARLCHHSMPFAPFAYTGLALVVLFMGTMLYGYWFGRKQLHTTPNNTTQSYTTLHHATQSLHINTGLGCTLPVRIGVPPEITVITLQAE